METSIDEADSQSGHLAKLQLTQMLDEIVDDLDIGANEESLGGAEDLVTEILDELIEEAVESVDWQSEDVELSSRAICSKFVDNLVDSIPHDEHSEETSDERKPTTSTQTCVSLILRALDNLYQ